MRPERQRADFRYLLAELVARLRLGEIPRDGHDAAELKALRDLLNTTLKRPRGHPPGVRPFSGTGWTTPELFLDALVPVLRDRRAAGDWPTHQQQVASDLGVDPKTLRKAIRVWFGCRTWFEFLHALSAPDTGTVKGT